MLKTKVEIQHFRVPVHIGCSEAERSKPQEIAFDVSVYFDGRKSLETDNIGDTVDYLSIKKVILDVCDTNSVSLLERLAALISQKIYDHEPMADEIHLKLKKLFILPESEHVGVALMTRRKNLG